MKNGLKRAIALFFGGLVMSCPLSCVGTTGGELVTFNADASGPADVVADQPLTFQSTYSGTVWTVVLTKATIHIGAVYLDQSQTVSGGQDVGCFLPGTYVGQVTTGVDVDLLSPTPVAFPQGGEGTTLPSLIGQVWLTQGDVTSTDDSTPILHLEGTATTAADVRPFTADLSIGENRLAASGSAAGADPICKERIVSPIAAQITLSQGGTLHLVVDPRLLFVNIDFSQLAPSSTGTGYAFKDDSSDQPSAALYSALRSSGSLYKMTWSAQ
jgi:hypothetical protein